MTSSCRMESLPAGIYEALHTARLERAQGQSPGLTPRYAPVEPADAPDVLARHLADAVRRALAAEREPELQLSLVNRLLELLDMRRRGDRYRKDRRRSAGLPAPLRTARPTTIPGVRRAPPRDPGPSAADLPGGYGGRCFRGVLRRRCST